jgi:hypothetical protein
MLKKKACEKCNFQLWKRPWEKDKARWALETNLRVGDFF